jgi:trehalose/maltose hydrolase-like predicted phosphorylase
MNAGAGQSLALAVAIALLGPRPSRAQDSTFLLTSTDARRAPSPFIGNGHVGLVVPALGLAAQPSMIAGLYEHGPGDVPRIVSAPAWNGIGVFDGARWLDSSDAGAVESYRQVIDMRHGVARTGYDWVDGPRRTAVEVEAFVSRADPGLAAVRLEVTPRQSGRMRVRFALAGWPPPRRLPLATAERAQPTWGPPDLWYPGHVVVRGRAAARRPGSADLALRSTPEGRGIVLAQAASVAWPRELPATAVRTRAAGDSALVEITFDAAPGRTYGFTSLVSFAVDSGGRPLDVARAAAARARARGYNRLAADNAAAWGRRWETDIVVDGNPELQRVVRALMFYLLCSADAGTAMGIPPMGLSSGGYYGHVFWDSDTWMFPALLLTHPDLARSLVAFRARTLPAAQANARANGYRGAMYPWEADELGRETTPHFAVQNARGEIHVNGDVALAQWQYWLATGDSAWLARDGFPVIRETANFWLRRASYDSAGGRYHIRNVVSVAEGLIGVSDDAYTNAVARRTLEIAAAASARLGVPADPRWTEVGARLHLPVDSASGFYRTYEGAPDSTLGWITPLLAYPLGLPMSATAKRSHLEQAVSRLEDEASGAMMGITLLSVGAAELGDRRLVDSLLPFSYRGHLKGPFLMASETPRNNAVNFVTGAGGFLQQLIFGYTGLRLAGDSVTPMFPAVLPRSIRRLTLRNLHVRGRRWDVTVDSTGRTIVPHFGAGAR